MPLSRRHFLSTLASTATCAGGRLLGADPPAQASVIDSVVEKLSRFNEDDAFNPSTLFLTWFRDPTTTMTVQWVGARGETSDTSVYYSSAIVGPWQSQKTTLQPFAPDTDLKVFRTELTELTPDTDYTFKIGKHSPTYRFRTMPTKATNGIRFISGGDCGINSHAIANNIQAARQDPMFSVIGGDLGYDNGRTVEIAMAFLRNYSRHMIARDGRLIPMLACLGNHEVDGGYGKTRVKAPFFYALFDGLFKDTGYATLDFGQYLSLVLLDTGHTSPIGGDQTDWLERTLAARAAHPHLLVVNHVPAYPSHRAMTTADGKEGTGEANRKHWVPLFEKHRVPVVLEHHDHTFKRTKPLVDGLANTNGVLYLGDGSWGRIRSPNKPESLPHLEKVSRDYHLSLHRIEGDERHHLALDEMGKVMDICRTGQRKIGLIRADN